MRFKLISEGSDVGPLANALEAHPEFWDEIKIRQEAPGTAHSDTECIYVRGPEAFTVESYFDDVGSYDYPAMDLFMVELKYLLGPIIQIMGVKELGRILIVKLKPGGKIVPHIDEGRYSDYFSRYHLPIVTNPDAYYRVENEFIHMKVGEFWQFNHKKEHTAGNEGAEDRIHLIVDMVDPASGPMVS